MARKKTDHCEKTVPFNNADSAQKATMILAIVLTVITVFTAVIFLYVFISKSSIFPLGKSSGGFSGGGGGMPAETYVLATHTPVPTTGRVESHEPIETPRQTIAPTEAATAAAVAEIRERVEAVPQNPLYVRHENEEYGFSCIFPKHFIVDPNHSALPYIMTSPEGTAKEIMNAERAAGNTPKRALEGYIASIGGVVSFSNSGDDFYVVSITNGNTGYYKYCKFVNGIMYSFEFINPVIQNDAYSQYIETIYDGFTVNE